MMDDQLFPMQTETVVGRRRRMRDILQLYAAKGATLKHIATPQITGRSLFTLKQWCRRFQISFPDYRPRSMPKPARRKGKDVSNGSDN